MKKALNLFTSYAHKDGTLVQKLLVGLDEACALSKLHDYSRWQDTQLILGSKWDPAIKLAMDNADAGLLILSRTFFTRPYIRKLEIPHFLNHPQKKVIPVVLRAVDFDNWDMAGVEERQVFTHKGKSFEACKGDERTGFINALFDKMEAALA